MTAGKRVVLALVGRGERPQAAQMAIGGEGVTPAGQDFVACRLMSHVPDDAIARRLENIVERNRQFHHAERTGEVTWIAGHVADDFLPQLIAQLRQRLDGQRPEVGREIDIGK